MNIGIETEEIEFKKSTGELKEGIISLTSMLNKNGKATLYFGVKNDGIVIGQQIGDNTLRDISQAIANFIKPQIIPSISVEYIEEKNVIKVFAQGNQSPYSAYGKYYMRSADEDREISPNTLRNVMLSTSDSLVRIESNNQVLSFNQLKMLYANAGLTLNEEMYKHNLNLLTQDGKYNLMANLLADNNSFSIKVAKFKGPNKTELIARNEYGYKCLLVAIKQVLDYAEAINETFVEIHGGLREETKLFDIEAFREAWLNACLHNRWTLQTPPAVYIFSDRIEIVSIGGLPTNYSLDDFYAGRSRPINLELQQIMVQLDYIEQTGHGVPLIVSKYGKNAFDITENFITVTIPLNKKNEGLTQKETLPLSKKAQSIEQKVLQLIKVDANMTVATLAMTIGVSTTSINNALKKLKEKMLIKRIGSNKTGYWEIL